MLENVSSDIFIVHIITVEEISARLKEDENKREKHKESLVLSVCQMALQLIMHTGSVRAYVPAVFIHIGVVLFCAEVFSKADYKSEGSGN